MAPASGIEVFSNLQAPAGGAAPQTRGSSGFSRDPGLAAAAFDALSEGVVMQQATGEIVACNPAAERILGLTLDQMAGRTSLDPGWRSIREDGSPFPGETHPAMETLRTGAALRDVVMGIQRPDGTRRWISISSSPIPGPDGKPVAAVSTFVDITDRAREKQVLAEENEIFRRSYLNSGDAIFLTDPGGDIIAANPAACRMLGRSEEEIRRIGRAGVLDTTDPRLPGALAERERAGSFRGELNCVRADGSVFAGDVDSVLFVDPSGGRRTKTSIRDLTEQKAAEAALLASREALRRSEETYRGLFDAILNGFAYCRMLYDGDRPVDWVHLNVNPAFEAQTGLVGATGRRVSELIPGIRETSPDLFEIYGRVARTGRPEKLETFVKGLEAWYSIAVYSPEREHFVAVFDDITERKAAERAVHEAYELLEKRIAQRTAELRDATSYNRSLIEASIDPLVTIGRDGRILDVNEATIRATGVSREELVESDFSEYFTDPESARAGYSKVFREGSVRDYELHLRRRDGGTTPVEYNASVYRDPAGKVLGVFAAARDISARKRFEERLGEANRELEAFSYSVSHELRAPLRAIDGFSALISEAYGDLLDDEGRRLFERMRWNAQRMGQLIDDLLTFARTGRTDLVFEAEDMTSAARTAFVQVVPDPGARSRISFSVDHLPEAFGDAALLRRVWENLLSNAVKFSSKRDRPEIRVEGRVERGEAVYRVRDNGVGFDMGHAGKLFGVFHRLHGTNEFEGTGVGLALVRRIVLRHGGRVWAEGELDRGATFSFALPVKGA
jgi:PAS domain S-box-containing protein